MPTLARYLSDVNPRQGPAGAWLRAAAGHRRPPHRGGVAGAWRAMEKGGFAANAIQNSVRELNLLDDLRAGRPARENHMLGFGSVAEGHTGSTFEGLFHAGVISALKSPTFPRYGADADHIQVKRGADGLARARQVVDAARHYTFFTLDVSDLLGYDAMRATGASRVRHRTQDARRPRVEGCPRVPPRCLGLGGARIALDEPAVGRLVGAYWRALDAVEELAAHVRRVKGGEAFDLELSIDETPPGTAGVDGITPPEAVVFLAAEIERRHLPVTHLAPNFGVEKGVDYRCPGGLGELEARVRTISRIAAGSNLMLDCHSGDDLGQEARRCSAGPPGGASTSRYRHSRSCFSPRRCSTRSGTCSMPGGTTCTPSRAQRRRGDRPLPWRASPTSRSTRTRALARCSSTPTRSPRWAGATRRAGS